MSIFNKLWNSKKVQIIENKDLEIKTDLTWNEYKNKRYFYTSMN
jgi:hypothetical protein